MTRAGGSPAEPGPRGGPHSEGALRKRAGDLRRGPAGAAADLHHSLSTPPARTGRGGAVGGGERSRPGALPRASSSPAAPRLFQTGRGGKPAPASAPAFLPAFETSLPSLPTLGKRGQPFLAPHPEESPRGGQPDGQRAGSRRRAPGRVAGGRGPAGRCPGRVRWPRPLASAGRRRAVRPD